jgi:hypothetical protein
MCVGHAAQLPEWQQVPHIPLTKRRMSVMKIGPATAAHVPPDRMGMAATKTPHHSKISPK